ncbi:MAG: hypothetical protein OES14_06980 [Nitrosopumilus sp.]|nr:hypothetical protein [Nitrosopumilus sp.]
MTQIVVDHNGKIPNQSFGLVGSEAKNPLLTNTNSWTDMAGLSWIFAQDSEILVSQNGKNVK